MGNRLVAGGRGLVFGSQSFGITLKDSKPAVPSLFSPAPPRLSTGHASASVGQSLVGTCDKDTRGTLGTGGISNPSQSMETVRKKLKVEICGVDQQLFAETLFPGLELPMGWRHVTSPGATSATSVCVWRCSGPPCNVPVLRRADQVKTRAMTLNAWGFGRNSWLLWWEETWWDWRQALIFLHHPFLIFSQCREKMGLLRSFHMPSTDHR